MEVGFYRLDLMHGDESQSRIRFFARGEWDLPSAVECRGDRAGLRARRL